MEAEDYQRAIMVNDIKGETIPAGRELSTKEINKVDECLFR